MGYLASGLTVGLLCFLGVGRVAAQQVEESFVTSLSTPGQLEIVKRPPAADLTRMPGRGRRSSLPAYRSDSEENWQVDVRSCDLSSLDLRNRLADLLRADFDSKTAWPAELPSEFDVKRIMELGKNPGLGLRALHQRGITGVGIGVAIIDQALLVDHQEYSQRLRLYEEIHWPKASPAMMHGAGVASIAVGDNVGVAPQADLYYIAEWHARSATGSTIEFELTPLAQAIDRIVAVNTTLPAGHRIRVISVSLGINAQMAAYDLVMRAIERAERDGIYTVYVGSGPFAGLDREPLADPDSFDAYLPGSLWVSSRNDVDASPLMVPMGSRCTAAPNGKSDYTFYRTGGASWTVPWVAGLYALACQVKPDITPRRFWEVARKTSVAARTTTDRKEIEYGRIIDPNALIAELR